MAIGLRDDDRAAFVPILVGNLLPLIGIALLGWRSPAVLFVYWVEIGLLVVTYSGLVLFATREPRTEGRTIGPPSYPVPFLNTRSGQIRPLKRLPPIYRRNIPYAIGLLGWGLGFWWLLALLLVVAPSHGTLAFVFSDSVGLFGDVFSAATAVVSPAILLMTVGLFASQFVTIQHEFFGTQRYERLSAPMVAEIPIRVILFWILLAIVSQLVLPVLLWPLFVLFDSRTVTELGISSLVIAGSVTTEWSTLEARRLEEPDGLAGWFAPEGPQSEQ